MSACSSRDRTVRGKRVKVWASCCIITARLYFYFLNTNKCNEFVSVTLTVQQENKVRNHIFWRGGGWGGGLDSNSHTRAVLYIRARAHEGLAGTLTSAGNNGQFQPSQHQTRVLRNEIQYLPSTNEREALGSRNER